MSSTAYSLKRLLCGTMQGSKSVLQSQSCIIARVDGWILLHLVAVEEYVFLGYFYIQ